MSRLIVVNGAPGVGKSTLVKHLKSATKLPVIGKDDIKEFLFDQLGIRDRDWSRILGAASTEMLYELVRQFLIAGEDLIIENAFWTEHARPALKALVDEHGATVIELYCYTDDETRMQRFRNRQENGQRHPGHVDNLATLRDVTQYEPLKLGTLIKLDTTDVATIDYLKLAKQIRS